MSSLKCCGFYNSSDFVGSPYYVTSGNRYPPQCCPGMNGTCTDTVAANNTAITGCFPKIKQLIDDNMVAIVAVALGIAVLEICAMVVSMILFCRIKSRGD
ncbi:tetraspanin 35 [Etheostoma cragini]|uniref:tetraspanin 35 n=1 Tax=Etheostoma cragini TaxID=417921 RepID=UPI00155F3DFB|nr:tetraspanin 35 [Etheostoma cragini]